MNRFLLKVCTLWLAIAAAPAQALDVVRGFSLTEIDTHKYDAAETGGAKTEAQIVVDRLFALGVRHISLSPRATMNGPRSSEIVPMTPPGPERSKERLRYLRLMNYIKSKGMTVGIRPIFFVVDGQGRTPVLEPQPDGTIKTWWHGNIQPEDPNAWFESFKTYLDMYMQIATAGKAEEFTLGAELYSMTVGIEDQWPQYPFGFPKQWLDLLHYAKSKLPQGCRVMYDVNFTDDKIDAPQSGNIEQFGGEFARWRYRLVDLRDAANINWQTLAAFWTGLDAVGIDMYRSLATNNQQIPTNQSELVGLLQQGADRYAAQIDNALFEIEGAVGSRKDLILKEIGYRSVDRGFINPFVYAGDGRQTLNLEHQAAAYEAFFRAFWVVGWDWFKGAIFWDASVDARLHGPEDKGFSILGKEPAETVVRHYLAP